MALTPNVPTADNNADVPAQLPLAHAAPASVFALFVRATERGEEVLLVQKQDGDWTLPGGRVASGETCQAALQRELREETGLDLLAGMLDESLTQRFPRPWRDEPDVALVYRLAPPAGEPQPAREIRAVRWFLAGHPPARLTATARKVWPQKVR
jgi:8-oxo-dGTP pyrophosphatase MutT (NUDIX family)